MRSSHRRKGHRVKTPLARWKLEWDKERRKGFPAEKSTFTVSGCHDGYVAFSLSCLHTNLSLSHVTFSSLTSTPPAPLQPKVSWVHRGVMIASMDFGAGLKCDLILAPTNEYLLDFGWVLYPLWDLVSSPVKWGWQKNLLYSGVGRTEWGIACKSLSTVFSWYNCPFTYFCSPPYKFGTSLGVACTMI